MVAVKDALTEAQKIPGWMSDDELLWLINQARQSQVVVEVGVWQGRSTKAMAMSVKGMVVAVDNFVGDGPGPRTQGDQLAGAFMEHLKPEFDRGRMTLIRASSKVAAHTFRHGPVDMVFIDGDHEAPAPEEDIRAWRPHVRLGGVLAGHDAHQAGVEEGLSATLGSWEHGPGGIWWTVVEE